MIKSNYPFIIIETKNTQLIFEIKPFDDVASSFNKGKFYISQRHYGKKIDISDLKPSDSVVNAYRSNEDYVADYRISSSVGDCSNTEPSIILDIKQETYTTRFFYKSFKIIDGGVDMAGPHARDVKESLIITEFDEVANIEIEHIYSVFEDSDAIAVKSRLINLGDDLKINRLCSLELPINSKNLDVYSFDGRWLRERMRYITNLKSGLYVVNSRVGSSSHKHNPFIEIYDNENQVFYGINLIYSGNHKEIVEVDPNYHSHVLVGINDFCFAYNVKKNDTFTTPEAVMVIADSLDEITHQMHLFTLNHIIHLNFRNKPRPIIFNNWEGTGFNINEKSMLEMAEIASRVGVELFVMDDGWFKNRKNETNGLGDWVVDKDKFPDGLGLFSDKVKSYGLKFGIWVEPEMISLNSDLCQSHPEFASVIPNREPIERRKQVMIDMTNPKVVDYLYDSLSKIIEEAKPDYIKWDYNRFMSDNYSSIGVPKGEYMHRFIMNSYSLMERLTTKYPNILFESCSSGGGRYDLGMLYYMPQTWGSDDSNSYWRSFIAAGTLAGYPQSSFGAHVSRDGNPFAPEGGSSSLEDRFNINSLGAFGYEFDFRTFNDHELNVMADQIAFYKKHRELLQYGNYYVIDNPFDDKRYLSYIVISDDKKEAILFVAELGKDAPTKSWKVKGLDENSKYHIEMRKQDNLQSKDILEMIMSGKELKEKGLYLGSLSNTIDREDFNGIFSRLFYLTKVE